MSEEAGEYGVTLKNKVDIHVTLSGKFLVYLSHNQVCLAPGATHRKAFKNVVALNDWLKRNKLEVMKVVWNQQP